MRTHLNLAVNFVGVADTTAYGLVVARRSEVGAGLGANPTSDVDVDWMLWSTVGVTTNGSAVNTVRQLHIDLKAKRKIQELDQTYALQLFNGNAASQTYGISARVLLALA
jgi:hypothetical protein